MSQLEQLKRQMKKTLPDFEREGYVLVGAINGLKREDYSDGSWDFIEFERCGANVPFAACSTCVCQCVASLSTAEAMRRSLRVRLQ